MADSRARHIVSSKKYCAAVVVAAAVAEPVKTDADVLPEPSGVVGVAAGAQELRFVEMNHLVVSSVCLDR